MDAYDDSEHRSKREKPKQQEIGQRTRTHARMLSARIYRAGRSIMLVRGEPNPESLRDSLCPPSQAAMPGDLGLAWLGFASSSIVPLSRGGLSGRARSVQQWRNWIEKRLSGRTGSAEARELRAEWQELESLGHRVADLHALVGDTAAAGDSPYWLEPGVESSLNDSLRQRLAGLHVPENVQDLARLVCWTGGLARARRFIESVRERLPTAAQHAQTQLIKRFEAALLELTHLQMTFYEAVDKHSRQQKEAFYEKFASQDQFSQLRQAFEAIPLWIRRENYIHLDAVDSNIDFEKLAGKTDPLHRAIKESQETMPQMELQKATEAIRNFTSIVRRVNGRLKSIQEENQRQKAATAVPFREQAREKGLFDKLRERFDALPEFAKSPDRIFLPGRDRDINLELTRKRTEKTLECQAQLPAQQCLNWLALFCLTDTSEIPPHFESLEKRANYYGDLNHFWQNRSKPGYDAVLANLTDIHKNWDLDKARQFLASGGLLVDINWFVEMEIYIWGESLYGAAASPFREIINWLRAHGAEFQEDEIDDFWNAINSEPGCALVQSLARFLAWTSRPTRQQVGEIMGLLRTLAHPMLRRPLVDRLRSWANPPARSRLPAGCPENLPAEISLEVRRLAFYQRMAGQKARIPGSVRDMLEARSRQSAELEHILSLGDQATPAQRLRLENLSRRINQTEGFDSRAKQRMLRQIREVTVLTALTAAKKIVRNEISRCWASLLGFEPDFKQLYWQEELKLVGWIEKLDPPARQTVINTLLAHREHGPAYRLSLPQNAAWLDRARGVLNLEAWLSPPAMRLEINGQTIVLKPAGHPADIYLMGSRFKTCLKLFDGENRASVITNAMDINKAVVYAWRADGTPIARRLVGIRNDWKMVGYHLYAQESTEELNQAFAQYCGTWAAKAGLGLANSGAPAAISRRFWYNDGAIAWTDHAYSAYREIQPDARFEAENREDSASAQFHQALQLISSNRPAAIAELYALAETRKCEAAFWLIRTGVDLTDETIGSIRLANITRTLAYHLAAAGIAHKLPAPAEFAIPADEHVFYWSDAVWSIPALVPPDRELITKNFHFLMQLPANPEAIDAGICFATCRISPAFGILPFRRLVALLRRFSGFFVEPDCGCDAVAWKSWAHALRMAWLREPDPAAFADAFADTAPIVALVMQLFCRICPDRRFSTTIRRQLRSVTESAQQATLRELRGLIHSIAVEDSEDHAEPQPEKIAFDPEVGFDQRLQAAIQLIGKSEKPDAPLGALLCGEWTLAEQAQLPLEMRQAFAEIMIRQETFEEWKTWPMICWLATLPEQSRRELLCRLQGQVTDLISNFWGDYNTLATPVLAHALEHPEEAIRDTATLIFRIGVFRKTQWLRSLRDDVGTWIWPEAYQKLIFELQQERPNEGDSQSSS